MLIWSIYERKIKLNKGKNKYNVNFYKEYMKDDIYWRTYFFAICHSYLMNIYNNA